MPRQEESLTSIFVHSSPEDARLTAHLIKHLKALERCAPIKVFCATDILPGSEVSSTVENALNKSQVGLILLSSSFLSMTTRQHALTSILLRRAEQGHLRAFGIILRDCVWQLDQDLRTLTILPREGKPVGHFSGNRRDQVLQEISAEIAEHVLENSKIVKLPLPPQSPLAAYHPSWYVSRPVQERAAQAQLEYPGLPVVLFGPEFSGKTWLLCQLLQHLEQNSPETKVISVNLGLFDTQSLMSLERFLRELAIQLLTGAGEDPTLVEKLWKTSNPIYNLKRCMEKYILTEKCSRVVLSIDQADAAWKRSYQSELWGMLRGWADGAYGPHWKKLRLILLISTTPTLLNENVHLSPFNLTTAIDMSDFESDQIHALIKKYNIHYNENSIIRLQALAGGHPYLIRAFLYDAALRRLPLESVLEQAPEGEGICDQFLRGWCRRLETSIPLCRTFMNIASNRDISVTHDAAVRLVHAGLLVTGDRPGTYRIRYGIYHRLIGMLRTSKADTLPSGERDQ